MSGLVATLKELRDAKGKTRASVAADLNMSERHLYRLENGGPLRHVLVLAFANYYGVEPDEIERAKDAA
jgi:transcriptional regulator with XRE-family HTH domain